jgi:hypothetical protein
LSPSEAINTPPVANLAIYTRDTNSSCKILIAGLIANYTSDADGDARTLTAIGPTSTQGATITKDSTWIYYSPSSPDPNTTDDFTYTISDGLPGGTVSSTIRISLNHPKPAPPPANLVIAASDGRNVTIAIVGISNYVYTVQRTTTLNGGDGGWSDLGTCTVDPEGNGAFTDNNPPPGQAYYRTRWP